MLEGKEQNRKDTEGREVGQGKQGVEDYAQCGKELVTLAAIVAEGEQHINQIINKI